MDSNANGRRPVSWPWLLLLQTPAVALRGRVVLLAAVGVLAVWLVDTACIDSTPTSPTTPSPWYGIGTAGVGSLAAVWLTFVDPFTRLAQGDTIAVNLLRIVARLAAWGLVGGAIARVAALSLTRDETPDLVGALRFAWRRASGFFGGPALLLAGVAVVWLPLVLVRLAMQASWLEPAAVLFWPLVIVAALLATIYTVGAAIGWPLVWAAAATDESDAFDTVSRMFSYVYQKPLRLMGYVTVIAVLGTITAIGAQAFATGVHHACDFAAGETTAGWATTTIAWWQSAAYGLVPAILTAYVWSAATGLYLLRRLDVDGVHMDEVFVPADELQGGLPTLGESSTGVPFVEQPTSDAA